MSTPVELLENTLQSFQAKLCAIEGCSLPRFAFLQLGDRVVDCESLIVTGLPLYQGMPGSANGAYITETGGLSAYSMDIQVAINRSVPTINSAGQLPPPDKLNKAMSKAAADAGYLKDVFFACDLDGSIWPACDYASFGGVAWEGPDGGMLSTVLTFSVQL